jgi:hypothetical protein
LKRDVSISGWFGSVARRRISGRVSTKTEKIEMENVNDPRDSKTVDADMYEAMKRAFLKVFPKPSPGRTMAEVQERVLAHLCGRRNRSDRRVHSLAIGHTTRG